MSNFRPINRDMDFLMPPSVDEWLPQRHLARFVMEVIEGLDLRAITGGGALPAEQIALATSGAVHIRLLARDRSGRPPLGGTSTGRELSDQIWS